MNQKDRRIWGAQTIAKGRKEKKGVRKEELSKQERGRQDRFTEVMH